MSNLNSEHIYKPGLQFDDRYLNHNSFFMVLNHCIPSLNYIGHLDGEKAFYALKEHYADTILNIHTYRWYFKKKRRYQFDRTIVQLKGGMTLEFDEDYCELLHKGDNTQRVEELTTFLKKYMVRRQREPQEVHMIVKNAGGNMTLKSMEIKRTRLELSRYYEDDFLEVDALMRRRLSKKNDKGIILLHGLPGTGKTTYLRYLIGRLKKRVLFLSPNVAGDLMDPGFMQILIANPNSIIVIEDAEHVIMDRRTSSGSSVSNLLNISDGLMADFLNVQIICTFNSALTMIDPALMRKGRLIARYEFGKLGVSKAQALSNYLGFDRLITKPMTLAEITNQNEQNFEAVQRPEVLGFRRSLVEQQ